MEQVQFRRQIPHPLCCPLPGSFLACKRCWIGPQRLRKKMLILSSNYSLTLTWGSVKPGNPVNCFNQHSMLGCSKKNQPWERLPTNKASLELLKHHKGEETLLKSSCSGSWQDFSMPCQEQNPVGFFLSCSPSLSNTKGNRVLSSVGLFCRVPSNPTRNTQGCISWSCLHWAL